jgi:hypothetical protein
MRIDLCQLRVVATRNLQTASPCRAKGLRLCGGSSIQDVEPAQLCLLSLRMSSPRLSSAPSHQHALLWGNFVAYADNDLLAFGWLFQGNLRVASYYHATQAVEKYLKALAISVADPGGASVTPTNSRWVRTHDLCELAEHCADHYPYYGEALVINRLKQFTEFDQLARDTHGSTSITGTALVALTSLYFWNSSSI